VQTGWQSWAKYEGIQREVHDDVMKYSSYILPKMRKNILGKAVE